MGYENLNNRIMKTFQKSIFTIYVTAVFILLLLQSCFKDPAYPKNSIVGTWRSYEQGAVFGYRQFNVNIERDRIDTMRYTIYNFYNKGFDLETYSQLNDTTLTIIGTNSFGVNFSGVGRIHPKYKAISWEYSYTGEGTPDYYIEAAYYRP